MTRRNRLDDPGPRRRRSGNEQPQPLILGPWTEFVGTVHARYPKRRVFHLKAGAMTRAVLYAWLDDESATIVREAELGARVAVTAPSAGSYWRARIVDGRNATETTAKDERRSQ